MTVGAREPIPAEAGAPGRLGPAEVLAAVGLVRSGEVVDLSPPLGPETPVPGHRPGLSRFMGRDGGDYAAGRKRPGGFQFAEDTSSAAHSAPMSTPSATPGTTTTSTTASPRRRSAARPAPPLGADKLPPTSRVASSSTCRGGRLPDGDADRPRRAGWRPRAPASTPGPATRPLRTGWLGHRETEPPIYYDTEPGLDVEGARWLAEARVAMVGADNFAIELLPFPGEVFPVHQRLIPDHGIPLLESVVLDELAARASGPFLFVALPLGLVGSTASPLTPVAVL